MPFSKKDMNSGDLMNLDTNTDYLAEDDAFAINTVVCEWPEASNPFAERMARAMKPGTQIQNVSPAAFMDVLGALVRLQPTKTFTFAVDLNKKNQALALTLAVINVANGVEPPLSADNAGFFQYALNWFADRKPAITVSVTSDGLFWVHRS